MTGMTQVLQRIDSIEKRFRHPAAMPQAQPAIEQAQSFSEILDQAEKQGQSSTLSKITVPPANNASKADIANLVQSTALKHGVNPKLALAVAKTESSLNQAAVSPVGAVGVMQLMPGTARELGVKNINNLEENIDGGVRYLRQMLDKFDGNVNKALAAYNAGPGAVKRYNGIPPFRETQNYVVRVNELAR
jgi:soluble lytic murein transglycosylase-like protein